MSLSTVVQFAPHQAQVQVEFLQDNLTEGTETINFRIYTDAAKTNLVATTPDITIIDTSADSAGDGQTQGTAVNVTDHWSIFLFNSFAFSANRSLPLYFSILLIVMILSLDIFCTKHL